MSQFFLTLIESIGNSATFYLFAFFSVLAYIWIWKRVPETKGRTFEEIQMIWEDDNPVQSQRDAGTL